MSDQNDPHKDVPVAEGRPKRPQDVRSPPGAGRQRDRAPRPPTPRRSPLTVAAAILFVLVVAIVAWGSYRLSAPAAVADLREFEVEPGWGARRVATELEAEGLIRDDAVFSLWLRVRGLDRELGEGVYELSPHFGAREIGRRLAAGGRPRTVRVVIPEGFRMADVAKRLDALGIADTEDALARMREPDGLRPNFVPAAAGLEGYLFPAAYDLEVNADTDEVLLRMLERFREEVRPSLVDRLVDLGLHVHEWVTLASMVQAEAADASEMNIIAGVFLNRLDLGMLLQSDPTVAYGLGKDLPDLDAVAGDLRRDHPWNTYTRPGLPVGPIGNPGAEALEAVLDPERFNQEGQSWLYFLHGTDDGELVFRPNTSLADHERDVELYLR